MTRHLFLLLAVCAFPLAAQPASTLLPLSVASPSDSSSAIMSARSIVRGVMERSVPVRRPDGSMTTAPNNVPGMAVAVMVDGRLVWSEGQGFADLERRLPVTPQTRFRIGSLSKLITAAAVMRLVEAGRMDLDAPVHRYVATFPVKQGPITIRQLAGHTSGIRHYRLPDDNVGMRSFATLQDGLRIFADDTLQFTPGTGYRYSSYGYNLLGVAIEGATRQRFASAVRALVLDELGMRATFPDYRDSIVVDRASPYAYGRDQRVVNAPYDDVSYKWPSGGYVSTAGDLAVLASTLLAPGFHNAGSLETMLTSQRTADGKETSVGIGWRIGRDGNGKTYYHHGGTTTGGRGFVYVLPHARTVVVMLANIEAGFDERDAAAIAALFAR